MQYERNPQMQLQNIDDELKHLIADYCYRTRRPYPNTSESLQEVVYLMLHLGYINSNEVKTLEKMS